MQLVPLHGGELHGHWLCLRYRSLLRLYRPDELALLTRVEDDVAVAPTLDQILVYDSVVASLAYVVLNSEQRLRLR